MFEIKDYWIVSGNEKKFLVESVMKYIKKGWQPIGGVCAMEEGFPGFYQAMVLYKNK